MIIRKATENESTVIHDLYQYIIRKTPHVDKYSQWKWNLHPTEKMINQYIKNGEMYLYTDNESIAGVTALTMYQGDDYDNVSWNITCRNDEVMVVHIFAIAPEYQGKGISGQVIDKIIEVARAFQRKVVRLDSVASNTPAQKLYQSKGFKYCGKQNLHTDNIGYTDFYYYEYAL